MRGGERVNVRTFIRGHVTIFDCFPGSQERVCTLGVAGLLLEKVGISPIDMGLCV